MIFDVNYAPKDSKRYQRILQLRKKRNRNRIKDKMQKESRRKNRA